MKIANIEKIIRCYEKYTISKPAFSAWVAEARNAQWKKPADIKNRYSSADILSGNRVVFKDNGFKDDSVKTNTKEILRNAGIDEIVSI